MGEGSDCGEFGEGEVMTGWQECSVEDIASPAQNALATGPFGSAISAKYFVDDGVPVIRDGNLSVDVGARLIDDVLVFLTRDKAAEFRRSVVRKGDLVFTCWGTINQVGLVDGTSKYSEYIISNKQMKLSPDTRKAAPLFLYYLFSSPEKQQEIECSGIGAAVPGFNLGQLRKMRLMLPGLAEQEAITAVLSNLDDKIGLLHCQNKTLEAMAETLFRQWFVEGARAEWKDDVVNDLIEFNPQRKLKKGTVVPYLEMASLSNSTFSPNDWYDREFSSGTKFVNGDTLLARITPCLENGKTAYVTFLDDGQVGWGSTEYIVMRPRPGLHSFFAYTLARNGDFRDYAEGCLAGSSGRQRVDVDHLKQYAIKIPSAEAAERFNAFAEVTTPKLHANFLQIRILESLRDTLLPKLMNGEVRVEV